MHNIMMRLLSYVEYKIGQNDNNMLKLRLSWKEKKKFSILDKKHTPKVYVNAQWPFMNRAQNLYRILKEKKKK